VKGHWMQIGAIHPKQGNVSGRVSAGEASRHALTARQDDDDLAFVRHCLVGRHNQARPPDETARVRVMGVNGNHAGADPCHQTGESGREVLQ
jgi:hypothetical protein